MHARKRFAHVYYVYVNVRIYIIQNSNSRDSKHKTHSARLGLVPQLDARFHSTTSQHVAQQPNAHERIQHGLTQPGP